MHAGICSELEDVMVHLRTEEVCGLYKVATGRHWQALLAREWGAESLPSILAEVGEKVQEQQA